MVMLNIRSISAVALSVVPPVRTTAPYELIANSGWVYGSVDF